MSILFEIGKGSDGVYEGISKAICTQRARLVLVVVWCVLVVAVPLTFFLCFTKFQK